MHRDNIFGDSTDKKMTAWKPNDEKDIVPAVVMNGKTVTEFDPEFFIVALGHGQPINKDFNILHHYDFPVESRQIPAEVRKPWS